MAEEKKIEEAAAAEEAPSGTKSPKGPLILALANTLAVLAVMGLLVYTKMIFKRPVITESTEREKLALKHAHPEAALTPGTLQFEPFTVNIQAIPTQPKLAEGTQKQIHGKLHYVNMGFALVFKDSRNQEDIEKIKPYLMDKLLTLLGHKSFQELTTMQGRYILRTQILEISNTLAEREINSKTPQITQAYFTHFIVQ